MSTSRAAPPVFSHAGIDFRWLDGVELEPLADALSDERVARFMGMPAGGARASVEQAAARHRAGQSLQLAIMRRDGQPLGRCGLTPYEGLAGRIQTVTYLCPSCWGGLTNRLAKRLLSEVAHVLGHPQVILSVALDNPRSIAAAARLTGQPGALCVEPWYPRLALRFVLRHAGDGAVELSGDARRLLAEQPAFEGLVARGRLARGERSEVVELVDERPLASL